MKKQCAILLTIIMMAISFIPFAKADAADRDLFVVSENVGPLSRESGAGRVKAYPISIGETGFSVIDEHVEYWIGRFDYSVETEMPDYVNGFPEAYYDACPEQGTVSVVSRENEKKWSSPICVYTPYGYENESDRTYNVVFLVSGSGGNMYNWLRDEYGGMTGNKLFDWLIYTKRADPFIAVSVNLNSYDGYHYCYADYQDLADRIERYYLPYMVRTYRTFADSAERSDIAAAKEHFMIAGLSQGAICLSCIALDPDQYLGECFGNIVLMSNYVYGDSVSKKFGDSDSKLFFVDGGKADSNRGGSPHDITNGYKKFENLKTAQFFEFDSGHAWFTWFRGIASVLQVAMK